MSKNIDKNLCGKYIKKSLHHAKQYAADPLKTASKRTIPKTAEATGDWISDKIANKIMKVLRTSSQNSSGAVATGTKKIGFDTEIPKERYISPKKGQKIVDSLRLK